MRDLQTAADQYIAVRALRCRCGHHIDAHRPSPHGCQHYADTTPTRAATPYRTCDCTRFQVPEDHGG